MLVAARAEQGGGLQRQLLLSPEVTAALCVAAWGSSLLASSLH